MGGRIASSPNFSGSSSSARQDLNLQSRNARARHGTTTTRCMHALWLQTAECKGLFLNRRHNAKHQRIFRPASQGADMANLIGIIDNDKDRRSRYIASVKPHLMSFDWLQFGQKDFGNATIAWATIPSAPISISQQADCGLGVILGNLGREDNSGTSDAEYLLQLNKDKGAAGISGQNGFYGWCIVDPSGKVALGTDLLGLFPLYYYATDRFLLFSTTPSLFRYFPEFKPELSPHGLVGMLLTMHITGGQSIWKGVRRLSSGHILQWQKNETACEQKAVALKPSFDYFGDSYDEHLQLFDGLMRKVVGRETAKRPMSVLLSGGLDSRLVAGYLSKVEGMDAVAVTFGDMTDYEMQCASGVARELKLPQVRIKADFSRFTEYASKLADLEQLSNGFNDLAFFQGVKTLCEVKPHILTGFLGDAVMGGSHIRWGYNEAQRDHSFESMFDNINKYGFPVEHVKKLVRTEILGDCLEEVMVSLRNTYYSSGGLPFQRSLMFDFCNRQRFHVASTAWRTSFGAWPIIPYADKKILEVACGMPAASLLGRRAQKNLLYSHFRALAKLPLDRNSSDTSPLVGSFYWRNANRLRKYVINRLSIKRDAERRYYYRVFDINNPGWRAVRQEAEQFRTKAERIFNPAVLRELLPPPNVQISLSDGIVDASGRKTLLGLMFWAGRNL
jgi:asparagine synthase (glutamine-hydrolysing)